VILLSFLVILNSASGSFCVNIIPMDEVDDEFEKVLAVRLAHKSIAEES
jgi:hypothetical protein